jgi:hypothetical protein
VRADDILGAIGNTPLVGLPTFSKPGVTIYAKLEGHNPTGSMKDRIALAMVDDAGRCRQLAFVLRLPETLLKQPIELPQSAGEPGAHFGIFHRLGGRGADEKTASRAALLLEVGSECSFVNAHKALAQRVARLQRRRDFAAAVLDVAFHCFQVKRVLVTECSIQAGAVHAGGRAQIVQRCACKSTAPERSGGAVQSLFRVVLARAAARIGWSVCCHGRRESIEKLSTEVRHTHARHCHCVH